MTVLYSFFSPSEIKAFMQTRGSYDAQSLMEIKLAPGHVFAQPVLQHPH